MLGIWCFRWIISDRFKRPYGQQSRLLFRQSMFVSQEGRFINFDIVKPLWKSNGVRGRMPNLVFWRAGNVLFVNGWVAMAWSKVLLRASWIWRNVFGECNNCLQHSGCWSELPPQKLLYQFSEGAEYLLPCCKLLRLNLGAWEEHLTSQLSSVATWLLVTRFICPIYLVHEESWCSMFSYDWANGGSVDIFFRHGMVSGLWGKLVLF